MRWEKLNDFQYAFIDEFGNYDFDFEKKDVSTHFMILCIIVKASNKELVEKEIEKISHKYFQTERMNLIDINDNLRIQILNDLKNLPFYIYGYVIDKRKIREERCVTYKKTFIKYYNRLVYEDLNNRFEELDLVADEDTKKEFVQEFKSYVERMGIPDLFNYSTFGFNDGKSDILLQLATLIAETIAKGYDKKQYSEHYRSFYEIIKSHIISINLLPHNDKHFLNDYTAKKTEPDNDEFVIKQAVNLAYQYIERHKKSEDIDDKLRINFLKFLLFNLKEHPDEYVYTQEILNNLNAIREIKINQHYFRSNIISRLRDQGVLIASSNKGYKLPVSLDDLYDFVNLSSLTIHPMIQRISKCRDQILLATNHEIDILEQKEYKYLKRIIENEKLSVH